MVDRDDAPLLHANKPDETEDSLLQVWFPAFDAQMLLAVADELEDRHDYSERVRVLVRAAHKSIDAAVEILERALGTGRDKIKRSSPDRTRDE